MDFEDQLDEQLDHAGEGLRTPDELDLAQDREDRKAGESQQDTAAEKTQQAGQETDVDLSTEKYEYELPDGTKFEGTFDEIVAKVAELGKDDSSTDLQAQIQELKDRLEQATKPPEDKDKAKEDGTIPSVDWSKSGEIVARSLGIDVQDMDGAEKESLNRLGYALQDGIVREVITNQFIAECFKGYAKVVLSEMMEERDLTTKRTSAFQEFAGETAAQEAEIAAFQKANPWATTKEMAVLGLKLRTQEKELADLKAGKGKDTAQAAKDAETKGRQAALRDAKAKGQLKRLTGGQPGGTQQNRGNLPPPKTEDERLSRWANRAREIEAGR